MALAPSGSRPVLLLLLTLLPFAAPARAASLSKAEIAAYADHLLAEAYPADAPGASAIVVLDGEVVLRKGYGLANVELQAPNGPEMVFELGSVTKQFTAAAILTTVKSLDGARRRPQQQNHRQIPLGCEGTQTQHPPHLAQGSSAAA
jgi:CubicO group peptidase (beta-lactamase class C family)